MLCHAEHLQFLSLFGNEFYTFKQHRGTGVRFNSSNDTNFQESSQNAKKVTHIKERLPDQAVLLFNCFLFQNGTP